MQPQPSVEISSGFIALVGPPNVGKSTLLNQLLGQKISIVSPKPQTTRNRILGVYNQPECQLIFLDTPGLHQAKNRLNSEMVKIARNTISEVDVVAYMIDAGAPTAENRGERLRETAALLEQSGRPAVLICNKIDRLSKEKLLPLIDTWQQVYPFTAIVPISALTGEGVETLVSELRRLMPRGPRLFPQEHPTNLGVRFICGEIVREKIMLLTRDELPYSTAVTVEHFQEEPRLTTIHATIMVEKDSQKGIIIGRRGEMLKNIGRAARKEIEEMLESRVVLKLWVKVEKNWTGSPRVLKELGIEEG